MECSLCGRALSEPFSAQVFFADGTETISDNRFYSDKGAVVIYRHKDCVESKPVLRKRRKGARNPYNLIDDMRSDEADEFVKKNYKIVRKGQRFLIVVPRSNGI